MLLQKEQIETLNSFCGYGDLLNADIIYFGIEEGLGLYDIEPNIIARCEYYGLDSSCWLDGEQRSKGFFEIVGRNAAEKMERCARDLSQEPKLNHRRNNHIQSLEFMSRLSLSLMDPSKNWFLSKHEDPRPWEIITAYWKTERKLYSEKKGIKTALIDWRPLPRAGVNEWPFETTLFSETEYRKAFDLKDVRNVVLRELVINRLKLIEKILDQGRSQLVIAFGNCPTKVDILSKIISNITGQQQVFQEVTLPRSGKKIFVLKYKIGSIEKWAIVSPFFDHKVLGITGLIELKELIAPIVNKTTMNNS